MMEEIVISGISGRFPESDNVKEFRDNLINGVDMVTKDDRRWPVGLLGLPERDGKLKDLTRFDANAFGINRKQANEMDPQIRLLLEATYEAIADAGINPVELRGKRVGVFVGTSNTDVLEGLDRGPEDVSPYCLLGCLRGMFANRVSFHFDFQGPSMTIDTACSSSFSAFDEAMKNIRHGYCDSAIVGGVCVNLSPALALGCLNTGIMSLDGKCKVFDADVKGYARSEAVIAVLLQKKSVTRREYATVIHSKLNNDGYKEQGITYPSGLRHTELLAEIYHEAGVNPNDVVYVECHGTGTAVGDPEEVNSIAEFFCQTRKEPLLVGALKSNMGHCEGASGLASVAKIIIAMEEGVIPANLHYEKPNPNIPALIDGRLKVVTENTKWNGGIIGVNNFGWGGANAHLILQSNPKTKDRSSENATGGLRLFNHASRTKENLSYVMDIMESNSNDCELYTLLSYLAHSPLKTHLYRGYTVLNGKEQVRKLCCSPPERRPLWYVFSGMSGQWRGMARDMMQVSAFCNTILRADDILKQFNVSLTSLICNNDDSAWNSTEAVTVAITVIEVAFINTLKHLGLEPDGFISHSLGELACAYADGCLTEEQLILASYWRVKVMKDNIEKNGSMATVGLTLEETQRRLPENVFCACHNAPDNVTVSGLSINVKSFVTQLKNEGVLARILPTEGLASHCAYVDPARPLMRKIIDKLIPSPKFRSTRWISTSFPESEWNSLPAKSYSAEYLVCSMSNPVYFYEALQKIPMNALVMEIGPDGLLQALIKRSLGPETTSFAIQKRNQSDGYSKFLDSLGKLYINGLDFDVTKLYEPVPLPVSRGTQMISPLIKWDHSDEYNVVPYKFFLKSKRSHEVEVSIANEESSDYYLIDHNVDGRVLYPAAGYLTLAWNLLETIKGKNHNEMSVVFENVVFHREISLSSTGSTKLLVGILDVGGRFEISENDSVAVSGRIYEPEDISLKYEHVHSNPIQSPQFLKMSSKDIYKEFLLRGYHYGPSFQNVLENEGDCGKLQWNGNWVGFLDAMVQFYVIGNTLRNLYLPTHIDYLRINTVLHPKTDHSQDMEIPVRFQPNLNVMSSGGIEIRGIKVVVVNRQPIQQAEPVLEHYSFVPFIEERLANMNRTDALRACLDIIYENAYSPQIKMAEVGAAKSIWFSQIVPITNSQPTYQADCMVTDVNINEVDAKEITKHGVRVIKWDVLNEPAPQSIIDTHMIFGHDILIVNSQLNSFIRKLVDTIRDGGFLLLSQPVVHKEMYEAFQTSALQIIAEKSFENHESIFLLRKVVANENKASVIVIHEGEYDKWVDSIKQQMIKLGESDSTEERLWLVAHGSPFNGIIGLSKCLCLESGGNKIRVIYNPNLDPATTKLFGCDNIQALKIIYPDIIKKDLFMNVKKGEIWGTYVHLPLDVDAKNKIVKTTDACVNMRIQGDLSTLQWIEMPIMKLFGDNVTNICQIYYAGLNFKDVMLASGNLSPEALPENWAYKDCYGLEFSGRDENGCRMMGVVPYGGLATSSVYDTVLRWDIPETWTMEDAATVPLAYLTVYYAFVVRGGINHGESILIHCGTDDLGQAAISIALSYECEIYTTVNSRERKEMLLKLFPKLKATNIFNSRDISFENDIMLATIGKGVDMVLNSLNDEKLMASVCCLAKYGRFLEIGKSDLSNNTFLGTEIMLKYASFHAISADTLLGKDHPQKQLVSDLLVKGIKDGVVKPLTRHVFNKDEVETAFSLMESGKYIGKILIKVSEEESEKVVPKPKKTFIKAVSKPVCSSQDTYVITGGLGGFGLELAHWLVDRGAQNMVLSSRTGVRDGYQSNCIRSWRKQGIKILISLHDITTLEGATQLLTDATTLGPVKGIFSLAMVLSDGLMENQTVDKFVTVCNPKVNGTQNLDILSRKLCSQLDWFVAFSSMTCGIGNTGQSNYGYANSVMERICEQRQQDGLHGLAIQWAAIGDVGIVMDTIGGNDVVMRGTVPQTIRSCITALEIFLNQNYPVVSSFVIAEKNNSKDEGAKKISLLDGIGHILGIKDFNMLNPMTTLSEMGMDSIMGVEIKELIEKHLAQLLTMNKIRKLNITNLQSMDTNQP